MALNVSYSSNNNGIDTQALKSVTQQIFKRAESKANTKSTVDFSNYQRNNLGMDFYNGRTTAATARQVALANAGLEVQMNNNLVATLQFLNTQAAKSVHKAVEGKVTVAVNEPKTEVETKTVPFAKFNTIIESAMLDQDKKGSNPFNQEAQKKAEEKDEDTLNIFA